MRTETIVEALREIERERRTVLDRIEALEDERASLRRRIEALEAAGKALAPLRDWEDAITPRVQSAPANGTPAVTQPVAPPSSHHFLGVSEIQ
jgi:hypothetical protein